MCASEVGVRSIFLSGDRAGCEEARRLAPGIETVEVKRGTTPGSGDELDTQAYRVRNGGAIHRHPQAARAAIRFGAERAIRRARDEMFGLIPLTPPYERVAIFRPDGDRPGRTVAHRHSTSVIAAIGLPYD